VLFAPELARGLLGAFVGAIRGVSQYRRASFLLGAAGQQVLPTVLQLSERPHLKGALASAPFDTEGVATRDRELVADGVLQGYVLGSYSARKLGLTTTGNAGGIHNLLVNAGGRRDFLTTWRWTGPVRHRAHGPGVSGVTGDLARRQHSDRGQSDRLPGAKALPGTWSMLRISSWGRMSTSRGHSHRVDSWGDDDMGEWRVDCGPGSCHESRSLSADFIFKYSIEPVNQ
jgi:hypothetical protein